MGITCRENEILSRSDNGVAIPEIAKELGLTIQYVRNIVTEYRISDQDNRLHHKQMEMGSKNLKNAVLAAGGHR